MNIGQSGSGMDSVSQCGPSLPVKLASALRIPQQLCYHNPTVSCGVIMTEDGGYELTQLGYE